MMRNGFRLQMARSRPTRRSVRGMSLIEVLVSMVIFIIGVLGLLSAHATAFSSFTDSKYRVDATLLTDRLIGEVWVDRANVAQYAYAGHTAQASARIAPWLAQLRQSLPAADAAVEVVGDEVRVTVTWQPRDGEIRTHVAVATLQGP